MLEGICDGQTLYDGSCCSTCLNQGIPCIKHGNTDIELVPDESQVLLESVESGVGDSVLVELVHEVHAEHDRHNVPIEFPDKFGLFWCVKCVGTKMIRLADWILGLEVILGIVVVFELCLGDGVIVACRLFELDSTRRGVDDIGRS